MKEAAVMARFMIEQMADQLPLFGKAKRSGHAPKRLQIMEYQVLELAAGGMQMQEIALRTSLHVDRGNELLERAIAKTGTETAEQALKEVRSSENLLPITMINRRRIG